MMEFESMYKLIDYLKDYSKDMMMRYKIPASVIIGLLMDKYIEDGYKLIEEYDRFIVTKINSSGLSNNDKILSITNALRILYYNKAEQIENMILSYQLENYDIEVQDKYILTTNIVEIDKKPNVDIYTIRRNDKDRIILKTQDYDEAVRVCDRNKATIYNSRGEIVYGSKKKKINTKAMLINVDMVLEENMFIELSNANLYGDFDERVPQRCISGIFRLEDGKEILGRYLISTTGNFPYTIGYVNKKDIRLPSRV